MSCEMGDVIINYEFSNFSKYNLQFSLISNKWQCGEKCEPPMPNGSTVFFITNHTDVSTDADLSNQ